MSSIDSLQKVMELNISEHEKMINFLSETYISSVRNLIEDLKDVKKPLIVKSLEKALLYGIVDTKEYNDKTLEDLSKKTFRVLQDLTALVTQAILLEGRSQEITLSEEEENVRQKEE